MKDQKTPQGELFENSETLSEKGNRKSGKKRSKPVDLTRKSLAVIMAVCILLAGLMGFGGAMVAENLLENGSPGTSVSSSGFDLEDATGSEMTVQEISENVSDSVVEIRTESVSTDLWIKEYVTEGAGSGVIVKNNGYIVTNNHVAEGASSIYVTLKNGEEYKAELIGKDSLSDLAVLKIDAKNLNAVTMGKSDQLDVGDLAVIIGNPLGELGGTVSAGIISALDREVTIDNTPMSLIQTDASVNPGNSGGGMFNQYGQLVGIVVAKSSGSDVEGLGFAIPINSAASIIDDLIKNGRVEGRANTGMSYVEISDEDQAIQYGLSKAGVYIQQVNGNNAKNAG
ncbi:MAG TPA: trypsin-like peptidase domain-containing protein, partial [Bacillota bacterium]|nr:trypsin-like peptidase domain-containing protein [Bacillota bacterium]